MKGLVLLTIMKNISDFDIQALIDNELEYDDEQRVRSAIQNDAKFIQRYEEFNNPPDLLQKWWKSKFQ